MTGEPPPVAAAFDTPPPPPFTPRRRSNGLLWIALIAFVLGIAAFALAWPALQRWAGIKPATTTQTPIVVNPVAAVPSSAAAAAPITIEGLAAREAALDLQLRAIESRVAYADAATRTSAADATRAERLMIAFAARRRIDRGQPLGPYEALLRSAFGSDAPQAVNVVIGEARSPLTIGDLREALDGLAPRLTSGSARNGIGSAIWREFTNLIVLRRDTQPSPRAGDRLERARRALDSGQIEAAIAEVGRMPGAAEAQSWTTAAGRYVRTRDALNALELIALQRPPAPNPLAAPASVPPAEASTPALPTQ